MAVRIDFTGLWLMCRLAAGCLLIAATPLHAQTQILDGVVAIVDEDVILASEYKHRLEQIMERVKSQGIEVPPEETLRQEVLDRLILEKIQLQMAERAGVRFSDAEINASLANIAAQNGLQLDDFRQRLEAQGQSYNALREQVKEEMIINRVQQGNLRSRVQVTEQDVDNFLRSEEGKQRTAASYRALHLLLPLAADASEDAETAARAYLEDLRGTLSEPGAFEQLLAKPPTTPYALSGGDLGWRSEADLPSVFAPVIPALSEGAVSTEIRSPSGFHLVKLLAKRGGGQIVRQTSVRHVLIKPSEIRSDEQARALAEKLRQQVVDGGDFAAIAKANSEDHGSALAGGNLGWTSPGEMVAEFEEMMNATPSGEVSTVFRTQFGWHFLEVLDRRDQDVSEEVRRNQARNLLYAERFDEELNLWLRKIRDEAFVEIKI